MSNKTLTSPPTVRITRSAGTGERRRSKSVGDKVPPSSTRGLQHPQIQFARSSDAVHALEQLENQPSSSRSPSQRRNLFENDSESSPPFCRGHESKLTASDGLQKSSSLRRLAQHIPWLGEPEKTEEAYNLIGKCTEIPSADAVSTSRSAPDAELSTQPAENEPHTSVAYNPLQAENDNKPVIGFLQVPNPTLQPNPNLASMACGSSENLLTRPRLNSSISSPSMAQDQKVPEIVVKTTSEQGEPMQTSNSRRSAASEPGTIRRISNYLTTGASNMFSNLRPSESHRDKFDLEQQPLNGHERPTMSLRRPYWIRSSDDDQSREENLQSDQMVDYLDVLDPAVGVFNTLQDYGNSTMLPNLPWLFNRRPTLRFDRIVSERHQSEDSNSPISPDIDALQYLSTQPQHTPTAEPMRNNGSTDSNETTLPSDVRRDSALSMKTDQEFMDDSQLDLNGKQPKRFTPSPDQEQVQSIRSKSSSEEELHTGRWFEMDEQERKELDQHIRHLLTNKSKTKRALLGFWNFVRTPSGFILTAYGTLITAWGIFIMLLIWKWVDMGNPKTQRWWIEICDQVLCALFTTVGLGFAPFRAVDTYRMAHIAHYHFLTYKRRKLLKLPPLANENELPRYSKERIEFLTGDHGREEEGPSNRPDSPEKELKDPIKSLELLGVKRVKDLPTATYHFENLLQPIPGQPGVQTIPREEVQKFRLKRSPSIQSIINKDTTEVSVLTPSEQAMLQHQQHLFHKSHTFYRYCETSTHRPFPLRLMMTIVLLLDCHSCLQATLGGVTWGIYYLHRPTALTATIITCSLSCNAMAGILIWQGTKRTRKTDVVERRVKLALEQQAIARMDRKRRQRELSQRFAEEHGLLRPTASL